MIYDFQDAKGNVTGFEFPVGKAPKIGSKIRRKGTTWTRIPSIQRVQVLEYACVDYSLPRRDIEIRNAEGKVVRPGVDPKTGKDNHPLTRTYDRVDNMGRPIFRNKQEIANAYAHEHVKKQDIVYGR